MDNNINREFMEMIKPIDLIVRKSLIPFLFIMAVVFLWFGTPFPIVPITWVLVIYLAINSLIFWIIKKNFCPADIAFMILLSLDCPLLAAAIYYTGGFESFMPILYMIIGLLAGLTLPFWGIILVILIGLVSYLTVLLLESFQLILHIPIYKEIFAATVYFDSPYLLILSIAYMATFVGTTFISYAIANVLRQNRAKLQLTNRELDDKVGELEELKGGLEAKIAERTSDLEKAKGGLEVEVAKRTEELVKEKASLEQKVKDRTAELQEKMSDLEGFNKLAVGRELRMIEYEKEVNTLLKELGREPKYRVTGS